MSDSRQYSQGAETLEQGVSFRVWAPDHAAISLSILDQEGKTIRETSLTQESEGYYSIVDPEATAGTLYKYRINGNLFPDPASRFQPHGVHGPSLVVKRDADALDRSKSAKKSVEDLVFYELHIGTFTPGGTYQEAIGKLDYLADLGITALEIMPLADFPGQYNWGYDGVCLFAPSRVYGKPSDLQLFIREAHRRNLLVFLDVVYTHLGPEGNYLSQYSKRYFDPSRHTPWGAALNFDGEGSDAVRSFFLDNAAYWLDEFGFDGLRLDAIHAVSDSSPRHLISEISALAHARQKFVVCEHLQNDRRMVIDESHGGFGADANWADDIYYVLRVHFTGEHLWHYGNFWGTISELEQVLREGWLYTGQMDRKGKPRGSTGSDLPVHSFIHCISNHDLVGNRAFGDRIHHDLSRSAYRAISALLLLSPYTPLLFMGQEWSTKSPFYFFCDFSPDLAPAVQEGRRNEFAESMTSEQLKQLPDPQDAETFYASKLRWEELNSEVSAKSHTLYKDCLDARFNRLSDRERSHWQVVQAGENALAVLYTHFESGSSILLSNLSDRQATVSINTLPFSPKTRPKRWRMYLSTNESTYGGGRVADLNGDEGAVTFFESETLLLVA